MPTIRELTRYAPLIGLPLTPSGLCFVEFGLSGLLVLSPTLELHGAVVTAMLDRTMSYWGLLYMGGTVFAIHPVVAMRPPLFRRPAEWREQAC